MATEAFTGDIRIFAFNFAPKYWALCNGQILPIAQNQALFSIIGAAYGGDGVHTFALPNMQGRVPVHVGTGDGGTYTLGQNAGSASVPLADGQTPAHIHLAQGSFAVANVATPGPTVLPGTGASGNANYFTTDGSNLSAMAANTLTTAGGGQPHENRQPSLVLSMCICLQGLFPSRN